MFEAPMIFTIVIFIIFAVVILSSLYFMLPVMVPRRISRRFHTELPEPLLICNALSFASALAFGYAVYFSDASSSNWVIGILLESKTNVYLSVFIGVTSSIALLGCHQNSPGIKLSPIFIFYLVLVTIPGLRYEYWLDDVFLYALSAKLAAYAIVFGYVGVKQMAPEENEQSTSLQSFINN